MSRQSGYLLAGPSGHWVTGLSGGLIGGRECPEEKPRGGEGETGGLDQTLGVLTPEVQ